MMLLNRLFKREDINGGGTCPTYLYRWTLFQPRRPSWLWRGFGVYLHKFVAEDWSRDLHDHPKRFISIGLKGSYFEFTPFPESLHHDPDVCGCENHAPWCPFNPFATEVQPILRQRFYQAPWVRTFPAEHIHRIAGPTLERPCWTLVIVLRTVREWGFWHLGEWIHWRTYVRSETAGRMKSCP